MDCLKMTEKNKGVASMLKYVGFNGNYCKMFVALCSLDSRFQFAIKDKLLEQYFAMKITTGQ